MKLAGGGVDPAADGAGMDTVVASELPDPVTVHALVVLIEGAGKYESALGGG